MYDEATEDIQKVSNVKSKDKKKIRYLCSKKSTYSNGRRALGVQPSDGIDIRYVQLTSKQMNT